MWIRIFTVCLQCHVDDGSGLDKLSGDEETVAALEARVDQFNVESWWERKKRHEVPVPHDTAADYSVSDNQVSGLLHNIGQDEPTAAHNPVSRPLYNICEGRPGARELSESVDDFLARLPPATTNQSLFLDWIWIANPYIPARTRPEDHDLLVEGGSQRLQRLSTVIDVTRASGQPRNDASKQISEARKAAIQDLKDFATACNVVTGKWMLFPAPSTVNKVWAIVARATANNELGPLSKVDTADGSGQARLICVYTEDFNNMDDIARVLKRLSQLGLVKSGPGSRPIYYKSGQFIYPSIFALKVTHKLPDAWTELGIYSGNKWGLGGSMVRNTPTILVS